MKSGVLCVCSTNVLVHFVFRCLVCKLPAFSHTTNRFCCLAVPEKCFFSLPAFAVYIFFASLVFCKIQYLRLFFVIFHTQCSFSNHVLSWSLSLCNNPPLLPPGFSLPFSAFALGLFNHWPECKTILETIGERKCFIHTQLLWKGFFWPEIRWGAQWECHRGTRYPWRFGFRPMFHTQQRRKVIPCIQRRRGPLARAG